jgi:1,4-alpha-glucan branching enzyme
VQTIAEESTAWSMVSRPTYLGGLGFGLKWDMGWMHDTLEYMARECVHRRYHHDELTFRAVYAFDERFVLPLSHDEVVHGKGSLVSKMPGDDWQKLANLRLLYAYMYATPGKKLLFMGAELAEWREWSHDVPLDWHLLEHERHRGVERLVADLNRLYRGVPALHRRDTSPEGFAWVVLHDAEQSVLAFTRRGAPGDGVVLAVLNFTPLVRTGYRVGVERGGAWLELLNSDAREYGGSGQGNQGRIEAARVGAHGQPHSLELVLPPLGALFRAPADQHRGGNQR